MTDQDFIINTKALTNGSYNINWSALAAVWPGSGTTYFLPYAATNSRRSIHCWHSFQRLGPAIPPCRHSWESGIWEGFMPAPAKVSRCIEVPHSFP